MLNRPGLTMKPLTELTECGTAWPGNRKCHIRIRLCQNSRSRLAGIWCRLSYWRGRHSTLSNWTREARYETENRTVSKGWYWRVDRNRWIDGNSQDRIRWYWCGVLLSGIRGWYAGWNGWRWSGRDTRFFRINDVENKKPLDVASGSGKMHVSQELFSRFSPCRHLVSRLQISGCCCKRWSMKAFWWGPPLNLT